MSKKYLYIVMCEKVYQIEISRETEKSYWTMNGNCESKNSSYQNTFNTLEEANSFLKERFKVKTEGLKQGIIGNIHETKEELSGEVSPVSGFPIEWLKYTEDGEYICKYCEHNNDNDWCCECHSYGSEFEPKQGE